MMTHFLSENVSSDKTYSLSGKNTLVDVTLTVVDPKDYLAAIAAMSRLPAEVILGPIPKLW